jgi:hypothetical protein
MNKLLLTTIALLIGGSAMAGGTYDGVYTGTRTTKMLRPGNVVGCAPADNVAAKITIVNDQFDVTTGGETFTIKVAADGTIKGSTTYHTSGSHNIGLFVVNFNGRIANGSLWLDRGNEYCSTQFTLKKS